MLDGYHCRPISVSTEGSQDALMRMLNVPDYGYGSQKRLV